MRRPAGRPPPGAGAPTDSDRRGTTMATKYAHEITVYVWNYHTIARFIPSGHFGHVAVRLRNVPGGRDSYISWWPGEGASKSDGFGGQQTAVQSNAYAKDKGSEINPKTQGRLQQGRDEKGRPFFPRPGQRLYLFDQNGDRVSDFNQADIKVFGQSADRKIRLPAGGLGGVTWGLDIVAMYRWWEVFRRAPAPVYKLRSSTQNCAGVAALALRAGMAASYAKPPRAVFFLDPNQVAEWASKILAVIETLNTYSVDAVWRPAETAFVPVKGKELMSLREWKDLSARNVSVFSVRSGQVARIDHLLTRYHALAWEAKNYTEKIDLLKQMMTQVHAYLGEKAGGKRQDAVLSLGQQITAVIKDRFGSPTYHKVVDWETMFA